MPSPYAGTLAFMQHRVLGLAAAGALFAAGYVAGRRSSTQIDVTDGEQWTGVLGEHELQEGRMRCVEADGTAVLLARTGGKLYALANSCSHRGGPLHEGEIQGLTVVCPWHESVFDLRDGALVHGPAAHPQPAWDARVRAGRIEVRRR
jgi:nitrite reductase/ring-hydroxylating ferredoxin subunit